MLPIRVSNEVQLGKGDFGAKVEDGALVLPIEMESILRQGGVRNAATLLSSLQTFPTAYSMHCGWTIEETKQATEALKPLLRGHIPDVLLDWDPEKNRPLQRGMGARAPEGHPVQPGYVVPPTDKVIHRKLSPKKK